MTSNLNANLLYSFLTGGQQSGGYGQQQQMGGYGNQGGDSGYGEEPMGKPEPYKFSYKVDDVFVNSLL